MPENPMKLRPFGTEFLEEIEMPPRGADMQGAACCVTWDSQAGLGTRPDGTWGDIDQGDPTATYCDSSDRCTQEP